MIISSKKYACETCIKGHRSSSCKHTDRPLYEIKKKGRPITQCEHCRELRKTKQVHVKCICEPKFDFAQQGLQPGFDRAAFPNGLPPALGTSVAFPNPGDGTSSDSDYGGVSHSQHCQSGDPCTCVTPRIRPPPSSDPNRGSTRRSNPGQASSSKGSTSSQILARIQELRPLVPRPPTGGPVHDPSMVAPHGYPSSRYHGNNTPYGRVQGMAAHSNAHPQSYLPPPGPSNPFSYDQAYNAPFPTMSGWGSGLENDGSIDNLGLPSSCGCGDDCTCPGCIHHSRVAAIPSSSAYASCSNPNFCGTCMDCTIMSLPSSAIMPPDTALSIYDSSEAIDDWLREMSESNPSSLQQGFSDFNQQQTWPTRGYTFPDNSAPNSFSGYSGGGPVMGYDSADPRAKRSDYPTHQRHRSSMSDDLNIDPRLLPPGGGLLGGSRAFLDVPGSDSSRSRSPSTSSQSSQSQGHHGLLDGALKQLGGGGGGSGVAPYRPSGRVQGMFDAGGPSGMRGAPQLNVSMNNMRPGPGLARGPSSGSPSSNSLSPSPGSANSGGGSGRGAPPYGGSPSSAHPSNSGGDAAGPSLAGLHIY